MIFKFSLLNTNNPIDIFHFSLLVSENKINKFNTKVYAHYQIVCSSSELTIFMIAFISVNPNCIKTLLANDLSTFFIKGNRVFK